jgi:peptide-methionine (S)-S-oxide reductase
MTISKPMKRITKVAAALALGALSMGAAPSNLRTAVFAGGCFWTMEHDMAPIPGVVDVVSGYAGGTRPNPSYPDHSGYLEAVKVTYDPAKISYPVLTARYLRMTDPTDGGGAFCDRGPSYRPAIFVTNPQEKAAAQAAIVQAQPHVKGKIATQVLPGGHFYVAESFHQDYAAKHPMQYGAYRLGCGKDASLRRVWR